MSGYALYDGLLSSISRAQCNEINRCIGFGGAAYFTTRGGVSVRIIGSIERTEDELRIRRTRVSPWELLPYGAQLQWIMPATFPLLSSEEARRLRSTFRSHVNQPAGNTAAGGSHAYR